MQNLGEINMKEVRSKSQWWADDSSDTGIRLTAHPTKKLKLNGLICGYTHDQLSGGDFLQVTIGIQATLHLHAVGLKDLNRHQVIFDYWKTSASPITAKGCFFLRTPAKLMKWSFDNGGVSRTTRVPWGSKIQTGKPAIKTLYNEWTLGELVEQPWDLASKKTSKTQQSRKYWTYRSSKMYTIYIWQ